MLCSSTQHSPSSETDSRSTGQEIPYLLRNRYFHYREHNRLPLTVVVGHMNPANPITPYLCPKKNIMVFYKVTLRLREQRKHESARMSFLLSGQYERSAV
jgi:hypothetical protein